MNARPQNRRAVAALAAEVLQASKAVLFACELDVHPALPAALPLEADHVQEPLFFGVDLVRVKARGHDNRHEGPLASRCLRDGSVRGAITRGNVQWFRTIAFAIIG